MVLTRRSARRAQARLEAVSETKDNVEQNTATPEDPIDKDEDLEDLTHEDKHLEKDENLEDLTDKDKDLEVLTDKVFERLKKQTRKDDKNTTPTDVLELGPVAECPFKLASSLQPELKEEPYFTQESVRLSVKKGQMSNGSVLMNEADRLLKKTVITADFEKKDSIPPINGPSKYARDRANKAARLKSAGKGWFEMPAPQLTPELKKDLNLLRMRNALDPSRHYKANDSKQLPRYFQVGRVVSGAGEFYSSRIPRRQQKQSLVEELLSNEEARAYHKKKYLELQAKFSSGTRRLRHIKHKRKFKK